MGYRTPLRKDEVAQARKRWMGKLEPIPLYEADFLYKWSIRNLGFSLVPLLPVGVVPASCTVSLHDLSAGGAAIIGPVESTKLEEEAFRITLSEGREIAHGNYQFRFVVKDSGGKPVVEGTRDWNYVRIQEDGTPMAGKTTQPTENRRVEATWAATFSGTTCDIDMACRAEYDGMIRYELAIKPKGRVGRIAFVVPLKAARAVRWLAHPAEARGVSVGEVPATDGVVLTSRADPAGPGRWRDFLQAQKKNPQLEWSEYWPPLREKIEDYGFYTHADLNDMNRGLWWFCDNAAGWAQSKKQSAIEVVRRGDVVSLELNLVAEPCDYEPGRPIVFAILPHPARPVHVAHAEVSATRHCG